MYDILWGFPPLSVLFLLVIVWAGCGEHYLLKRHQVHGSSYWRIMLFGLWFLLVPSFAMLWLGNAWQRHGISVFASAPGAFFVFALFNTSLRPVYMQYRRRMHEQSFHRVWVR